MALSFAAACAQPADPGGDDGGSSSGGSATSSDGGDTGGETDGGSDDASSTGMTTADATTGDGGSGSGGSDTGGTDGSTADGGTSGGDGGMCEIGGGSGGNGADAGSQSCEVLTDFTGQVGGDGSNDSDMDAHDGGTVASSVDALPADAGIQAVWDWIDNNTSAARAMGGADLSGDNQIEIQNAIVTATSFGGNGNARFWIQDQQKAIYVRLDPMNPPLGSNKTIRVGDEISFTVTNVAVFSGEPQIGGVSDFTRNSQDNPVAIQEVDAGSISPDMYGQLVRAGGLLTAKWKCDSPDRNCCNDGCYLCYDYLAGSGGDKIATFRSNRFTGNGMDPGYFPNSCLTYVGPLGMFPGPFAENPDESDPRKRLQFEETNYAWTKRPGTSN